MNRALKDVGSIGLAIVERERRDFSVLTLELEGRLFTRLVYTVRDGVLLRILRERRLYR